METDNNDVCVRDVIQMPRVRNRIARNFYLNPLYGNDSVFIIVDDKANFNETHVGARKAYFDSAYEMRFKLSDR